MPQLIFRLFGRFEIFWGQQVVGPLVTGKARELLCYLLLRRRHPHARETLAGRFWGDTSTAQSRKYLRKAIWQLQAALGCNEVSPGQPLLRVDRDWIVLELNDGASLDVADFEDAFASARGACHGEMTVEQAHALQTATKLYCGDLLEGFYQDWCLYDRERLQNIYLWMLDRLMAYCETHQQPDPAIDYGERILSHDPAHEPTHQRLMRVRYATGDRAGALRQYKRCCLALKHEVGVGPSQNTLELFRRMRGEEVVAPKSTVPHEMQSAVVAPPWNSVLLQLEDVMKVVSDVCRLLREELAARQTSKEDSPQESARPRSSAA